MSQIEIVLILMGTVIMIISCFIVEKPEGKNIVKDTDSNLVDLATENIKDIRDKIDAIISEATEETVENTENHLSKISNEKIIAVNDYSNQVLEKINENHEEVVFLYNMLNEKEREVKNLLKQMDATKTSFNGKKAESVDRESNTLAGSKELNQMNNTVDAQSPKSQLQNSQLQNSQLQNGQLHNRQFQNSQLQNDQVQNSQLQNNELNSQKQINQVNNQMQNIQLQQLQSNQALDMDADNNIENNNKEILDLYKQGKSILDISKMLEIGQGEVKLVIDLFN